MYSKLAIFLSFFLAIANCLAQDCNLTVKGKVLDEASGLPLSFVNVLIQEKSTGTITDDEGSFLLEDICAGEYHFIFSHIGCDPEKIHVDLVRDTLLEIVLFHASTALEGVVVKSEKETYNNQSASSVNRKAIEDNANQNLSGLLENEAGVHLLKNGSGISKPVVHGLYGNRLMVLNNGIAQSGQQWGNDHSPEIDPFSADKITVLKGANAIEYGGNLGSAILVEPKRISREPHLHGQFNYAYETNGQGNNFNVRLEKYSPFLAWRISGTLKKSGDKKTAFYFLNNTGTEEANLSIQLEKTWKEKLFLDIYASTFNTRLGILRGSHVGNLTDLEQALESEQPFYTEPDFSYEIDAPKQHVSHHLAKLKTKYFFDDNQWLELILAGQLNNREEFDLRRGGRSDIPALSLEQYTFNVELKYSKDFKHGWKVKLGSQNIATDNTNNPETGVLPLIPDYLSLKSGLFSTLTKKSKKTSFNIGLRYDFEQQSVAAISKSIPREIIRYENNFHNLGGVMGLKFLLSTSQSLGLNIGFASRNPAINELYSNGLHQGVSGIEVGDVELQAENAIKSTLEYKWVPSTKFSFSTLAYYQQFGGYIYLNPQDEVRLTIRGAFPVFKYEQTDAEIYGLDISTQFMLGESIHGQLKYSYIKGDDSKDEIPLVYMPPNSLYANLAFRMSNSLKISKKLKMEGLEFEVNNRLVLEQKHLLPEQDFVLPPPSYTLLGAKISTNFIFPSCKFRFFVKADNLLNTKYRDYLNRQRYFADDTGFSITAGLNLKF